MALDANALSHLKVKDLQRELKKRDLDTSGLKAMLLQRLKAHLQQEELQEECRQADYDNEKKSKEITDNDKVLKTVDERKDDDKHEFTQEQNGEGILRVKRDVEAILKDKDEDAPNVKKAKLTTETETISSQPENEDTKLAILAAKSLDTSKDTEDTAELATETRTTLRIDNFIRPFTLNAVKSLVQELGNFVENGFWMDAIKTHCFVTYPTSEIAVKTSKSLNGKVWPPENGRSLQVKFVDHTAMEVVQSGEANIPSQPKIKDSEVTPSTQRQVVTIDEFFQKTETKPVLYYLPLTDEEVKERKQRQGQQPMGQPRKRRHRGGRKRNRRGRFRR
ncbi:putative SAP domain, nucleotide-binding alpha-beta plait domain superfamily, acinus, RNA recognition [Plasmopara halstedii]